MKQNERLLVYAVTAFLALILVIAVVFGDDGAPLSASLMDYAMPRADNFPPIDASFLNTPCPHNPLGVKGCGEAGAIAAPAALANAVTDALGVRHLDMPFTPQNVCQAANAAK